MSVIYVDCRPDARTLLADGLDTILPDLVVHDGDPAPGALAALAHGHAGILTDHTVIDAALIEASPALRVVVFLGVGASTYVDMAAAARHGVVVENVAGYGGRTIAEHAFALMLAAARNVARMDRHMRAGGWAPKLGGPELAGRRLGILGLGDVGRRLAAMGHAFSMEVVAWNRSGVPEGVPARALEIDEVIATSDVLSLNLATTPETTGLLDRRRIALMPRHAILVNTARAALIDGPALVEALAEERIAHAALDVFDTEPLPADDPLLGLENTTLTPHTAWLSPEAARRLLRTGLEKMAARLAT